LILDVILKPLAIVRWPIRGGGRVQFC
jgi:hypothetical protein